MASISPGQDLCPKSLDFILYLWVYTGFHLSDPWPSSLTITQVHPSDPSISSPACAVDAPLHNCLAHLKSPEAALGFPSMVLAEFRSSPQGEELTLREQPQLRRCWSQWAHSHPGSILSKGIAKTTQFLREPQRDGAPAAHLGTRFLVFLPSHLWTNHITSLNSIYFCGVIREHFVNHEHCPVQGVIIIR